MDVSLWCSLSTSCALVIIDPEFWCVCIWFRLYTTVVVHWNVLDDILQLPLLVIATNILMLSGRPQSNCIRLHSLPRYKWHKCDTSDARTCWWLRKRSCGSCWSCQQIGTEGGGLGNVGKSRKCWCIVAEMHQTCPEATLLVSFDD